MRGAVDPAGKAGNDDKVLLPEIVREATREAARGSGGIPCADDRHRHPVEQVEIAFGHQQRRRILKLGKQPRIQPLPERQIFRAEILDSRHLALRLVAAEQTRRRPAPAPREIRNSLKRRRGAAEARDQLAKGDGADSLGADQPQPVDQVLDITRGSVPFERRRMFSRCFHSTSAAKPSSIGKSA